MFNDGNYANSFVVFPNKFFKEQEKNSIHRRELLIEKKKQKEESKQNTNSYGK